MSKLAEKPANNALYEADFYLWTQQQAQLLREKRWNDLDLANLAEEVESVGKSEKKEIRSRLQVLMMHLLKWKYQPGFRTLSWSNTISEQRDELREILSDSPSLRGYLPAAFAERYRGARLKAEKETGIAFDLFPQECPFTLEQVLDPEFFPDEPGMYRPTDKLK